MSRCSTSRCPASTASPRPSAARAVPTCRVLMVTTFGRPGYLRQAMSAGASGFVVKDTPARQLADAVRRVHSGLRVVDPTLAAESLTQGDSPLTEREADVLQAARSGGTVARSPRPCSCPRARCATTCPARSARPAPVRVPKPYASPSTTAGSCRTEPGGELTPHGVPQRCVGHRRRSGLRQGAMPTATLPRTLRLGDLEVPNPVVLAPMAGRDECGVPPALRRAGRRPVRLRDDHVARHRRGRQDSLAMLHFAANETFRSVQLYGIDPDDVGGRRDPLRRPWRRPRRPQLRLPGPQGDPQGRGCSAALEAPAARRDPQRGRRPPSPTACRSR